MGLMDKAKKAVRGRSDRIEKGIDAAAKQVDKRTGGKYADKVAQSASKAKARARELDEKRAGGQVVDGGGQAAPGGHRQPGGPADPRGASPTDPESGGTAPGL